MNYLSIVKPKTLKLLTSLMLVVFILSCTSVRIIAPYDSVTDEKISNLQEQTVTKFLEWEREIPPIEKEYAFYDKTESTLEILIMRNESIEKSKYIVGMLQKLKDNYSLIKGAHKSNELSYEVVKQIKPDIMAQYNAIQKFLMALKKGEEEK